MSKRDETPPDLRKKIRGSHSKQNNSLSHQSATPSGDDPRRYNPSENIPERSSSANRSGPHPVIIFFAVLTAMTGATILAFIVFVVVTCDGIVIR